MRSIFKWTFNDLNTSLTSLFWPFFLYKFISFTFFVIKIFVRYWYRLFIYTYLIKCKGKYNGGMSLNQHTLKNASTLELIHFSEERGSCRLLPSSLLNDCAKIPRALRCWPPPTQHLSSSLPLVTLLSLTFMSVVTSLFKADPFTSTQTQFGFSTLSNE